MSAACPGDDELPWELVAPTRAIPGLLDHVADIREASAGDIAEAASALSDSAGWLGPDLAERVQAVGDGASLSCGSFGGVDELRSLAAEQRGLEAELARLAQKWRDADDAEREVVLRRTREVRGRIDETADRVDVLVG